MCFRGLLTLLFFSISSQGNSVVYSVKSPAFSFRSTAIPGFTTIRGESLMNASPLGKPSLPIIPCKIVIPQGKEIDCLRVSVAGCDTVTILEPLDFGRMPRSFSNETIVDLADSGIYNSDKQYPSERWELVTEQKKAGISIAHVNLFPAVYHPLSNRIITAKQLELSVTFRSVSKSRNGSGVVPRPERIEQYGIINPEALSTYGSVKSRADESVDYVILTSESMINAVAQYTVHSLIDLRQQQGLSTKLITVEEILASAVGVDKPQKIRNYLRDAYNSMGFQYLFIAGDTNVVPARELYAEDMTEHQAKWKEYWLGRYALYSDIYYQCLDGDYNSNGNDLWGEFSDNGGWKKVDLSAEFAIGRIAAENGQELSNFIEKTIKYETMPSNDSYLKNALLLGEFLGMGQEKEYAKPTLLELKAGTSNHGYTTIGFDNDSSVKCSILSQMDSSWHEKEIAEKINTNSISVISHLGHGLAEKMIYINDRNSNLLTNEKPLFIYSQACMVGKFDVESIAEHLTTELETGFFGGILNSGFGKTRPNITDGPSAVLNRWFWDGHFKNENPITRLGDLNNYSHEKALPKIGDMDFIYVIYGSNLHGDPYTQLRLSEADQQSNWFWLLKPSKGTVAELGKVLHISWGTSLNLPATITLLSEGDEQEIATGITGTAEYNWNIPTDILQGDSYRIKITIGDSVRISESFSISAKRSIEISSPVAGEVVIKNGLLSITWSSDYDSTVAIVLKQDGRIAKVLTDCAPDNGLFSWRVDSLLSTGSNWFLEITPAESPTESFASEAFELLSPAICTYPYFQDFETFSIGPSKLGSFDLCDYWEQGNDDQCDWTVLAGPTPSQAHPQAGTTGPTVDHTKNDSTGKYLYVESSGENGGKRFDLLTPPFDLNYCGAPEFSFWYHMRADSGRMGDLIVEVLEEYDTASILELSGDQGKEWKQVFLDISEWEGSKIRIRFRGEAAQTWESDICIDDVVMRSKGEVALTVASEKYKRNNGISASPSILIDEPIKLFVEGNSRDIVTVSILDMLGHELFNTETVLANSHSAVAVWDGTNKTGRAVASGTFVVVVKRNSQGNVTYGMINIGVRR